MNFVGTPNYTKGRGGRKPIAIVNHITGGLCPGCLAWMQNPKAKVSAHYLITREGEVLQLVKDEDTAWANGGVKKPIWDLYDGTNPNRYTISIEHEGFTGDLTDAQYNATVELHKHLIDKWDIPITDNTIIGHYRINSVDRAYCPGPKFPWKKLFDDLQEPNWMEEIMMAGREAGLFTGDHKAQEPAEKWFVVAIALNIRRD